MMEASARVLRVWYCARESAARERVSTNAARARHFVYERVAGATVY